VTRPDAPAPRPRRRHPAARSRIAAGTLSVLAFLAIGGSIAARAARATSTARSSVGSTVVPSWGWDQGDGIASGWSDPGASAGTLAPSQLPASSSHGS